MFLITYLHRELRRRMRQSALVAVGLAFGVGLVVTVTAAATGVSDAQRSVLHSLYGIGTDITVTRPAPSSGADTPRRAPASAAGGLSAGDTGLLSASTVTSVSRLRSITAAAGGLALTEIKRPSGASGTKSANSVPTTVRVDGTDVKQQKLGPYGSGDITSGRGFTASDVDSDVAVVDSHYASANRLSVGGTTSIAGTRFTVVGIITQPHSGSADLYIPLARAQELTSYQDRKTLDGKVNVIYLAAASAADVASVRKQVVDLLPSASVTTSEDLAKAVSGSLAGAAHLADDLGSWLEAGVLVATFAMATLLTMAAVTRRVREFGTLKALGWRTRRVIAQIMAESLVVGVLGAVLGVALGFGGAGLIGALAPELSATTGQDSGSGSGDTVEAHLTAHVSSGTIALAVLLALAGSLIAGSFGGWRASRMRPADALAQLA